MSRGQEGLARAVSGLLYKMPQELADLPPGWAGFKFVDRLDHLGPRSYLICGGSIADISPEAETGKLNDG